MNGEPAPPPAIPPGVSPAASPAIEAIERFLFDSGGGLATPPGSPSSAAARELALLESTPDNFLQR